MSLLFIKYIQLQRLNSGQATAVLSKHICATIGLLKTYSTITIFSVQQMNTLFLINKTCTDDYVIYVSITDIVSLIY